MKNEIIQNSGKLIFNIGDLLKSDDFLKTLKDYLNTTNNIDKNNIYMLFNKIKNGLELDKEELTYIYYFLNTIGKNNNKKSKYNELLKLKNYIFEELCNNKNGLINEIKNYIFNLLNIKSFEIKTNSKPEEYYGNIGIITSVIPDKGIIIGSKGITKINRQTGKLEKTTGDLGIGNISFYNNSYTNHYSSNNIEDLYKKENIYVYGDNGIVIINIFNLQIINKTEDLGIGNILEKNISNSDNEFYLIGTKGIVQIDNKNLKILTKLTYKEISEETNKIEKQILITYELEYLIEEIERNNYMFTNIIENPNLINFLKNIDLNISEIKKEFTDLEPENIIQILSLFTGLPESIILKDRREDKVEIKSLREILGVNEKEINNEEILLFGTYIKNSLYNEKSDIGKKYKEFLINHILSFAKKELPNINENILNNITNLSTYIKYYIDNQVVNEFIDRKGKNDELLSKSYGYKKEFISDFESNLGHNPFLQSILEKIELEMYGENEIQRNEFEYISEGVFHWHKLNGTDKFIFIKDGKIDTNYNFSKKV